ncbi:hypothetical protein Q9L58_004736 [Maublancomyces gigas]|uniref:Amidoligase enzyme n=1 Tax=Discina gigas TaxID=1032678 RepID=A0ABR3GK18_9PEZI
MSVSEQAVTIGVELEFLIRGLPKTYPRSGHFKLATDALTPLATRLRVQVLDMVNEQMNQLLPREVISEGFQVKRDMSIKRNSEVPPQRSMEIATPILRNERWKTAIPEMIQILSSTFSLDFNYSTGLHVHIGIGREYTLRDLKRIASAVVIFEEAMDSYHPRHRCHNGNDSDISYISSNRESFMLHHLSDTQMLRSIEEAQDIEQLLGVINSPFGTSTLPYSRHYRYNLTSIRRFQTIEFRQAAATDDSDHIVEWIGMIIKFITTAISTPEREFRIWARDGIPDDQVYRRFGVPIPEE